MQTDFEEPLVGISVVEKALEISKVTNGNPMPQS